MTKEYTSLGLMSGTSGDGVDASIITSDGKNKYKVIMDKYFEYDDEIYKNIHNLKEKINQFQDLNIYSEELKSLEKKITLFHAKVVKEITKNKTVDLVGFHGQTIYHNSKDKISKQLGDGNLLFQLIKKNLVYNFRENDIKNGGEGAPLTPIFHQLIIKQQKIDVPSCILNIGGISNITIVGNYYPFDFTSRDIGPGNCLIDSWVRKNSKKKFDKNGILASRGKTNEIILEQAQELYSNRPNQETLSLDVNDFDVSFARGLSLEDGTATLTDFTGRIIGAALFTLLSNIRDKIWKVLICGGGRKNKTLIERIKQRTLKNIVIQPIDDYGIDGDFVESQAFAYLAIRSFINEPISFPDTTGCSKPSTGGVIIKN
ncbi:MAG: anhydro-N-acetylmuramic acid kinase [Candidatus Pelagibacter sp.]|nr:anhydro-N-acetylmuramic acid kinase [Candidatus Pelagibacter sp.]|tara:strand:+ start:12769 stop:13887 length:1119 start_codon:yes stop_codon:yes gene_type:complete